jgi:hypothetical protein
MSVCVYSVFVLSCVQVAVLRRADHSSKESYRLCIHYGTEKAAKAHTGCIAIEEVRPIKFSAALNKLKQVKIISHKCTAFYVYKYYVSRHYQSPCFTPSSPEIRTSSIDWAQLSRVYLKTETESSLQKVFFFLSPLFITICLQAETMSNIFVT